MRGLSERLHDAKGPENSWKSTWRAIHPMPQVWWHVQIQTGLEATWSWGAFQDEGWVWFIFSSLFSWVFIWNLELELMLLCLPFQMTSAPGGVERASTILGWKKNMRNIVLPTLSLLSWIVPSVARCSATRSFSTGTSRSSTKFHSFDFCMHQFFVPFCMYQMENVQPFR